MTRRPPSLIARLEALQRAVARRRILTAPRPRPTPRR